MKVTNRKRMRVSADCGQPVARTRVKQTCNLTGPALSLHSRPALEHTPKIGGHGAVPELARRLRSRAPKTLAGATSGDRDTRSRPGRFRGRVNATGIATSDTEGKRCAETLSPEDHRQDARDFQLERSFTSCDPWMHRKNGRKPRPPFSERSARATDCFRKGLPA